jgi:Secretion system C-terminal sorting domain
MIQSLQSAQSNKSVIQTMDGPAVYKARTLYAYYEPDKQYDDKKICINTGQNKTNKPSSYDDDDKYDSLLHYQIQTNAQMLNKLVVYPNPANDYINIISNTTGQGILKLYNNMGSIVLTSNITDLSQTTKVNIATLPTGLYYYNIVTTASHQIFNGKLCISE